MSIFGNHAAISALKRASNLLHRFGIKQTLSVCIGTVDDQYLRRFDRRYGVKTSGYVSLATTSFDRSRLKQATSYAAVNAWAFRWVLKELNLSRNLHFVDLGCGLGRACIIAAEYGFEKVTGVELAPELCAIAHQNTTTCRIHAADITKINIVEGDALRYCEHAEDDLFFMYRPFSPAFSCTVRQALIKRAEQLKKIITIIYSERLSWPPSDELRALSTELRWRKFYEGNKFGQAFYVYRSGFC